MRTQFNPNPPPKPDFMTGDPATRRCLKCHKVKKLAEFRVPMTEKQLDQHRFNVCDVFGYDLIDGVDAEGKPLRGQKEFLRGYTRPAQKRMFTSMKCAACHAAKPKRPNPATYTTLMEQINIKRRQMRKVRRKHAPLRGKTYTWQSPFRIHPTVVPPWETEARLTYAGLCMAMLERAAHAARAKRKKGTFCPPAWEQLITEKDRAALVAAHALVNWRYNEMKVFRV